METQQPQRNLRERLLLAGIEELDQHGFQSFSVRRVAAKCGVSCAAPYKHFKDKQSFIATVIEYINSKWNDRQKVVIAQSNAPTRKQILDVSVEYVRFLVENSQFRSIIMLKYEDFDNRFRHLRSKLNGQTYILVAKYCKEVNMSREVRIRKTFAVRSFIYGAALMFDNGELDYTEENMQMVSDCIDREFDLP